MGNFQIAYSDGIVVLTLIAWAAITTSVCKVSYDLQIRRGIVVHAFIINKIVKKKIMYMKLLRKIALLFLMLTSVSSLNAQISPKSVDDLMAYFENNFQNLDPIEGAYDVNIEQWGENAYRQFPSETTNITMLIYKSFSGDFKIYRYDQITIKRIGITPAYNFNIFWKGSNVTDSKRFVPTRWITEPIPRRCSATMARDSG